MNFTVNESFAVAAIKLAIDGAGWAIGEARRTTQPPGVSVDATHPTLGRVSVAATQDEVDGNAMTRDMAAVRLQMAAEAASSASSPQPTAKGDVIVGGGDPVSIQGRVLLLLDDLGCELVAAYRSGQNDATQFRFSRRRDGAEFTVTVTDAEARMQPANCIDVIVLRRIGREIGVGQVPGAGGLIWAEGAKPAGAY